MRILALLPLLIFALSSKAQMASGNALPLETEASCTNIDMSKEFPSPRDQGMDGYCYAFAAADLLGHELGVKPPDAISAMHVLSHYITLNKETFVSAEKRISFENVAPIDPRKRDILGWFPRYPVPGIIKTGMPVALRDSGYFDITLSDMIASGKACLESEVPSQGIEQTSITAQQAATVSQAFGFSTPTTGYGLNTNSYLPGIAQIPRSFINDRIAALSGMLLKGRLYSTSHPVANPLVPQCPPKNAPVFALRTAGFKMQSAVNDWAAAKFRSAVEDACKNPLSIGNIKIHTAGFHGDEDDIATSHSMMKDLFAKRKPFILGLDASVLWKRNKWTSTHAAIVVGRKWNKEKNRCDLQVRNSSGGSCDSDFQNYVTCYKNGTILVPMDTVLSSNHEITYLEKK